jgi:hypothetical protein
VLPTLSVAAVGGSVAWLARLVLEENWHRPLLITLIYALVATAATWALAMESWERVTFRRVLSSGVSRLRGWRRLARSRP